MESIMVSACLLGSPVRYDGGHKHLESAILQRWLEEGRVVPVCPETAGGLPVPRPPAEIAGSARGDQVLAGTAEVLDAKGRNVTNAFIAGAEQTLREAQHQGIRVAVLKEGSPSCGSTYIYDGSFTRNKVPGRGITAALLEKAGIRVFSETRFAEADEYLRTLTQEE